MIVVGVVAFLLGVFLSWLYLSKIKYAKAEYDIARLSSQKAEVESDLAEATAKIARLEDDLDRLQQECRDINDYRYAVKAREIEDADVALTDFTEFK